MKSFKCRDAGMDCDWSIQDNDENRIVDQALEHGKQNHGIRDKFDEVKERVRSKIQEVKAA